MLLIQLLLLYFPSLQLFAIPTDNGQIPASLCYFFSLVFVPYLLMKLQNLRLPPWYITSLFFFVFIVAVFNIPNYGLSKSILHWAFGLYLLVIILNVGSDFSKDEWMSILDVTAFTFMVAHFLFMIIYNGHISLNLIKGYYSGEITGSHGSLLLSITRGGRNLDATWLGLGAFFVKGRRKPIYITYAILFSFFGGSRVGIISIFLAILWTIIYDENLKLTKKNIKWYAIYVVCISLILVFTGTAQGVLDRVGISIPSPKVLLSCFADPSSQQDVDIGISTDEFLSGRGAIWPIVPKMIRNNCMGYGVGNAMRIMRTTYGFAGTEDVVHNVLMQWTVDEGILGGVWFLVLVFGFFWSQRKKLFSSPFAGYLLTYIVLSIVQFHGAEALMLYVVGVYILQSNLKLIRFNKENITAES